MQTFNKPYRVRKEGGIFSSLIGALIGILFVVIGSPLAAWYAESQHRADDFSTAHVVEADGTTEGYIAVEGDAIADEKLSCPHNSAASCIYVQKITEQYSVERKERCGNLTKDQVEIEYRGQECDSDGSNCKPCYVVDEYSWDQVDTESEYAKFAVGSYAVKASDQTNFIGAQDYMHYESEPAANTSQYVVGDIRHQYTYFSAEDVQLVAGDAKSQSISGASEDKPFIVSNTGYAGTLAELESQDRNTAWGLRIVSLVLMVVGVVMIFGPLTAFTNIFKIIPFLGKRLDKGFDAVITFIAALIGFVLWLLLFAVVMVIKNIWIIIIVLGIIGIGVFILVKRGKKSNSAEPQQPPTTPPTS